MRDLFSFGRPDTSSRIMRIPSFNEVIESIKIVLQDIGKNLELCFFEDGEYVINNIRFKKIGSRVRDMSVLFRDNEPMDINDVYSGRVDVQEDMDLGKFHGHLQMLLLAHQATKELVEEKTKADSLLTGMFEKFKDPHFTVTKELSRQEPAQDITIGRAVIDSGAIDRSGMAYRAVIDTAILPMSIEPNLISVKEIKPKKEKKTQKDKKKDEKRSKKKDKGK